MMNRKILWLVVSSLMVLSLVMAACGPAEEEGEEEGEVAEEEVVEDTGPKYGGTITYRLASDPGNFDSASQPRGGALVGTVYQQFMGSDWLRGPADQGVSNFAAGAGSIEDSFGPQIAESWEMPEKGVWILNIRQGVHWQPVDSEAGDLMGGRELTVDDIIYGFDYLFNRDGNSPESWIVRGQSAVAESATIEKTGPWQVTIRTPEEVMTAFAWVIQGAGFYRVYPPEVIAKYGDVSKWENAVGTGPYMLLDYVEGSQFLFEKNPIYWEKDPVGPGEGNQLPYADTLTQLIIPDLSTTYAALRTGKLDLQSAVTLTDAQTQWQTTPELEYLQYGTGMYGIGMAQDFEDNPYSDFRVRQALMLATDFEAIQRDYYDGEAEMIAWPANPSLIFYESLDELPQSVQELYQYNPERAKELLTEAGYPDGFKTSIIVQSTPERIDELSIIKDMWAKVGVEVVLNIKESGAYRAFTGAGVPYEEMLYRVFGGSYFNMHLYQAFTRGTAILNVSHINNPPGTDPYLEELFLEQEEYLFVDMPRVYEAVKKVNRYVMEKAFVIPLPVPYRYSFWWPWLKNYYGQGTGFIRYAWIDQDMKKSMGY
ncbi:MAG: ABC transporter substrate-binding protein [Dehalococcoidales bacterium]